jgi:hypothetical protein
MSRPQIARQIIPKIIPVLAFVLLAGCAGAPQPITQQVDIPVFTPCVKEVPLKPDYEFGKLSLDATDGDKVLALAQDWPRGRKYEGELEAVIAGCL